MSHPSSDESAISVGRSVPKLLGEILVGGVDSATQFLIARIIELDAVQESRIPTLLAEADEDLAEAVFSIQDILQEVEGAWTRIFRIKQQIGAASLAAKSRDDLGRIDVLALLQDLDIAEGGAIARADLKVRLNKLAAAYVSLPVIDSCNQCGRILQISDPAVSE